ncbi:MAG: permease [Salinisphaeraceae bacterium]|nr:permease [Salinisphaeraceae bacterium]
MTDCHSDKTQACHDSGKRRIDWLLWGSLSLIVPLYLFGLAGADISLPGLPIGEMGQSVFELMNTMAWGMALAFVFVGLLGHIPREMVLSVLGPGGSFKGIARATLAGVALDLCNHGILMVGMRLYERGASAGQVMAFLIASPWNSLSLTVILWSLIGLGWTLAFIALSLVIAIISGLIFEALTKRGTLPSNPHDSELPEDYAFSKELRALLANANYSPQSLAGVLIDGIKGSQMVLRWLLFGTVLAVLIRVYMDPSSFETWFGATLTGLGMTILAATIIEVCSEGSVPIAADLLSRANAPGNAFAFLMAGAATDYTEIMSIKDTMRSWKLALFLPLITLPQVLVIAWLINNFA